jgi:hypothetical protein
LTSPPTELSLLSMMRFLGTRGGGGKDTFIKELAEIDASPIVTKPSIVELELVEMESCSTDEIVRG